MSLEIYSCKGEEISVIIFYVDNEAVLLLSTLDCFRKT